MHRFFFFHLVNRQHKLTVLINTVLSCKCVFAFDFLNDILFSLAYFVVRIVYNIIYKICVNQLFVLLVRLPVNNRLLVVKFWRSQKLYVNFQLHQGLISLPPVLFKG